MVVAFLELALQGGAAAHAAAPLAGALLACLHALQASATTTATSAAALSPRQVLDELRAKVGADTLPPGAEHDAAEALEVLCDLVAAEVRLGGSNQRAVRAARPSAPCIARSRI